MIHGNDAAFPESYIGKDRPHEGIGDGLTVRAYFAAKAMQGLCGNVQMDPYKLNLIATMAVRHADALIAALNGETA